MTIMELLIAWIMVALMAIAPPATIDGRPQSPQDATPRYRAVAEAIVRVAYDTSESPSGLGPFARFEEAALLTAIVGTESGMHPDVLAGKKRGDGGRSWCVVQMNIGKGKTVEGWTGPELAADIDKCLKAGLHAARRSIGACRNLSRTSQLSGYTRGSCVEGDVASIKKQNVKFLVMGKGWKLKVPADTIVDKSLHPPSELAQKE